MRRTAQPDVVAALSEPAEKAFKHCKDYAAQAPAAPHYLSITIHRGSGECRCAACEKALRTLDRLFRAGGRP